MQFSYTAIIEIYKDTKKEILIENFKDIQEGN